MERIGKPGVRSAAAAAFGARIRETREEHGWSLARLADEMMRFGVKLNAAQVSKVELGQRATSVEELLAFADAMKVEPARLLSPTGWTRSERLWMTLEAQFARAADRLERVNLERADLERELAHVNEMRDRILREEGGPGGFDPTA